MRYEFNVTYYFNVFQAEDLSHAKGLQPRRGNPLAQARSPLQVQGLHRATRSRTVATAVSCPAAVQTTFFASYTLQSSGKFPSLQETLDVHVDRS
jgi:hypothetical protein